MGIMTGGVVCPTAAKKCEVKLERLPTANGSNSATTASNSISVDSNKFKRPLSSSIKQEDSKDPDDLRPPVKLKVRLSSNNASVVKTSSLNNGTSSLKDSKAAFTAAGSAHTTGQATKSTSNEASNNSNNSSRMPLKRSAQLSRTSTAHSKTTGRSSRGASPPPATGSRGAPSQPPPQPLSLKKKLPPYQPAPAPPVFDLELNATEFEAAVEKLGYDADGNLSTSLMDGVHITTPIPLPPSRPSVKLTDEELLPPTPCVYINDPSEAYSPQLLDLCLKRPIVMVRNLASACNMDLSLYSTKTLVEMHPNHPVEVRTQMEQTSDENWSPNLEEPVWYCTSSRSHTTISKHAEYQAETIRDYMKTSTEKTANPNYDFTGQSERRILRFGTNCDLSDDKKWGPQLRELNKLPAWVRVISPGNMLTHMGNQILGMNTVQLYMKVPCARTPGHQENNNFCAANINIGPGDSEWFGVPNDYWGALQNLCSKNDVDFLHGSWWPKMEELREAGIPCYRFMQRPGDLVWVNVGCVHWVQAAGWCNNIAWNVGPLTERQFVMALERYEWNKSQRYQSIVAMCLLSWNLARNIKTTDPGLFKAIRKALQQTLRHSIQVQNFVKDKGISILPHGRRKNEPAHYCGVCDEEVFNNLFVKENAKPYVVHCLSCSLAQDSNLKGFLCLEEYPKDDLFELYDNFKLLPRHEASLPKSGLGYCELQTTIPQQDENNEEELDDSNSSQNSI